MAADRTRVVECGDEGCTNLQLIGNDLRHITATVNKIEIAVEKLGSALGQGIPSKTASATIGGGVGGAVVIIAEVVRALMP